MNEKGPAVRLGTILLVAIVTAGCSATPAATNPSAGSGASVTPTAVASGSASEPARASASAGGVLFDDFSYASPSDMAANGWILRTKAGWPGVKGGIFDSSTIKVVPDSAGSGNRLLQISATADGTTVHESQVCQQRKFLAGTYAARVYFNDAPTRGQDGDPVVETFYLISPYVEPFDPSYSEVDNEYLPNGGWGGPNLAFYVTTWHTVQIEPWSADNKSDTVVGSEQGWHTLVVQIESPHVRYYLDGNLVAAHGEHYYPRVPMSINFNLWFADLTASGSRQYDEQIDWVYHKAGVVMSPNEVQAAVAQLRSSGSSFQDTVPASGLDSPCDL